MRPLRRHSDWPAPLGAAAISGLAGEITEAIRPISEADPVAVLVQLLTAFGNAVGRGPHFRAEADRHGLNLYTLVVGDTAKGRKGTSWGHVRALMQRAAPDWSAQAIHHGLSSAEGLISLVRDVSTDAQIGGVIGRLAVGEKRALIVEPEFASVLSMMKRHGNNLSEVIRNAWDGERLQTITKHSPLVATDSHISIIGHVTAEELKQKLREVETSNGFLNRFLLALSTRSKILPHGGRLSESDVDHYAKSLATAIEFSKHPFEYERDQQADALWVAKYAALSEGHAGQFGGVVSRSEAQVMRLACVYAALSRSRAIGRDHLEAALAVWRYAEDSAAILFQGRFGNPKSNKVLVELRQRPEGMTTTEIHRFLSNHGTQAEVEAALETLADYGAAHSVEELTGGRPATRWFAT